MPVATAVSVPGPRRDALRELLLRATASAGRDVPDPRLADLVATTPLDALPALADLHRVSGCVHQALAALDGVGEPVMAALDHARNRAQRAHLGFSRALMEIGAALDAATVPWLVMKGPALTSLLYRDIGARTYGDLDVLVAQHSLPEAVAVLERLDYDHLIKDWPLAQWFLASEFVMRRGVTDVDLHWHVAYAHYDRRYFAIDPRVMLERARRVEIAGRPAVTFDKEDMLLHLALHAARSGGHRLVWFKDIERSLVVDRPDLDELLARARAFRCGPPVGLALGRAKVLLGAEVSDDLVTALLGRPLAHVDRAVTKLSAPIGFDEGDTLSRFVARSVRSSLPTTLADMARRSGRWGHRFVPRRPHETSDRSEKEAFLNAVAARAQPR